MASRERGDRAAADSSAGSAAGPVPAPLEGLLLGSQESIARQLARDPGLLARLQRSAGNAAVGRLLRDLAPPPADPAATGGSPFAGGDDAQHFLDRVQAAVTAVAEEELTGPYRTAGCPWIEHWIAYYREREPQEIAAAAARYAPEIARAGSADEWVAGIAERVRTGIRAWQDTGEVPDAPADGPGPPAGEPPAPAAAAVARTRDPRAAAMLRELGPGRPLDAGVRGRMEPLLGADLSGVRVHADAPAVPRADAQALAIGRHVAFAPGRYEPGTPLGDALIAHELAHVVQHDPDAPVSGEAAAEQDATRSAAEVARALWVGGTGARGLPAVRSGLALRRCPSNAPPDPRIWVPAPTSGVPGRRDITDIPGQSPAVGTSGGHAEFRFDSDGDQHKDLTATVTPEQQWPDGAAQRVRVTLRQISSGIGVSVGFDLPQTAAGGGHFGVRVAEVTDGHDPTAVQVVDPPGDQRVLVHPPHKSAKDLVYDLALADSWGGPITQRQSLSLPPDLTPQRDVFSTMDPARAADAPGQGGGPRQIADIWVLDLTVGAYGDRFRFTLSKPDPLLPTATFGISVLSGGAPVAGEEALVTALGPLKVAMVASDPTHLALDIDGDGKADVHVYDRLTADMGAPESNRDHRILVDGPALTAPKTFSFPVRDGQIAAGSKPGEHEQAASQARAVTGLEAQAGLKTADDELQQIDKFLISMRTTARDEGLISKEMYGAWEKLSMSFIVLGPAITANTVTEEQKKALLGDCLAFHSRLAEEAKAGDEWGGSGATDDMGEHGTNPYTGGKVVRSNWPGQPIEEGIRIHEAPIAWMYAIEKGDWPKVTKDYRKFVEGMDRWIAARNRERYGTAVNPDKPESARANAIEQLAGQRRSLSPLEGSGKTRVSGVLHLTEDYEHKGEVAEVPLSMYYWKDGSDWKLQDFSRTDEQPYWTHPAGAEQEPPPALFAHLNDNNHFPKGLVHYALPSGAGGTVRTTGPSILRRVLTWGAVIAGVVGLGLVLKGGAVEVLGLRILAASALIGGGMAVEDIIDRAKHGTLSGEAFALDILDIVNAATGLGAMKAGRILTEVRQAAGAGAAAKATGAIKLADRWFLPLTRASQGANMLTLAVILPGLEKQFDELQKMPPGEGKERALRSFFLQAAMTGGIAVMAIHGAIPELKPGRNIRIVLVNGIEYAIPEGMSVAGKAINESRAGLGAGGAAAEQTHLAGIRKAIGGAGGAALAEIEELALHSAAGDVTVDTTGRMQRAGRDAGRVSDLVEKLTRANSEAAAHGVEMQYGLRIEPPGPDGRGRVRVVAEPRSAPTPAQTMQTFLAATTGRTKSISAMAERLHTVDPNSRIDVLPDGRMSLNGQIDIDARRLEEMAARQPNSLEQLLVGTRLLAGSGGDIGAMRAAHPTEAGWLEGFARSGSFRLRFPFHAAIGENLGRTGFGLTGDAAVRMNALMDDATPAQRTRMYDLYNEGTRGNDNSWRTLYAEYALSRNPQNVTEFVNHYQFVRSEIDRRVAEIERLAAARLSRAQAAGETIPGRRGPRAWTIEDARADVIAGEANKLGLPVPARAANVDAFVRSQYESAAGRTQAAGVEDDALKNVKGQTGRALLEPGSGPDEAPAKIVERIRKLPRVPFGEDTTAAYHVHKHHSDLPPGERFGAPGTSFANEHEAILASAKKTIDNGAPDAIRSEVTQDGTARRFYFERTVSEGTNVYRLRGIVIVDSQGNAVLVTYGGGG